MFKYLGRLLTKAKTHLLSVAEILGFPEDVQHQMRRANDEECEALLLSQAEGRHGGPVDWRGTPEDVYAVLGPCLTEEERALFPPISALSSRRPPEVFAELDEHFRKGPRALRSLESFGDFSIVLLIPRHRVEEFDRSVGPWLA